jgi:hypothetical protein
MLFLITVAMLTVTNAKLASQVEAAEANIKTLADEILALKAKIKQASQVQRPANYCSPDGCQVHNDRTSATCKARKDIHPDTAPKDNTLGGVAWGGDDAEGQLKI